MGPKYSGGSVGLAGGSSTGRNVEFRLTVKPDPNAPRVLRMFGEDIRREQALITAAAKRGATEWATAYRASGQEVTRIFNRSADVGVSRAKDLADAHRKAAAAAARSWSEAGAKSGPRGASAPGSLPGSHGGGFAAGFGSYVSAAGGLEQILMGGLGLARGASYLGLVGERDSQKVLDTLLKIEGGISLLASAVQIGRGIKEAGGLWNALGIGGNAAAASGASLPLIGAGLAAAAGIYAAGSSAYQSFTNPFYGTATQRLGGLHDPAFRPPWIASGAGVIPFASGTPGTAAYAVQEAHRSAAAADALHDFHYGREEDGKFIPGAMQLMQRQYLASVGGSASLREQALAARMLGRSERGGLRGGIDAAFRVNQANLRDAYAELKTARETSGSVGSDRSYAGDAAYQAAIQAEVRAAQTVKSILAEQIQLVRQKAATMEKAAQDELKSAQHVLALRRGEYEGKLGSLRGDLGLYGGLDRDTQRQVFYSARQLRAGGELSSEQEQLLSQFSEFRPLIEQRRLQRGHAAGGEELFAGGYRDARAAQAEMQRALESLSKTEIKVSQAHDVKVTIEAGGGFAAKLEAAFQQLSREIEELPQDIDHRLDEFASKIEQMREKIREGSAAKNAIFKGR